jgi:uncharacterized protein
MLELFKKHCPLCGIDVDKESGVKRFGKYFCSEEHANKFSEIKMSRETNRRDDRGFGCC